MLNQKISFTFDIQRFASTQFNIATGNTVLSSSAVSLSANQIQAGTLPATRGGTGQTDLSKVTVGTATSANSATTATTASSLKTARSLQVSLNKTSATNFQGNANVTNIGVQGILGTVNGGTGAAVNPSMLTNLGSTTAANVFAASPRPGVTGTLDIANGGTGATTAVGIYNNIKAGCTCVQYQAGTNTNPWYKVADITLNSSWSDATLVLLVTNCVGSRKVGILQIHIATNDTVPNIADISWLLNDGFDVNKFRLEKPTNKSLPWIIWHNVIGTYVGTRFTVLDCSSDRSSKTMGWALYDNLAGGTTSTEPTGNNIIVSTNNIHATSADSATTATTAASLTTARALQVSLNKTSSTNFQGNGNVTNIGVQGVLNIANGGTGQTTAALARNALGLGNTTGALPIANGGTGQTTAAAARNALGLGNTTGALPVANGGTGQTVLSAVNVGGATKATQDSDGNQINTTYAKLSGATFTGDIILGQDQRIVAQSASNYPIITNAYSSKYGNDIIVSAGQALVMGAGEAPQNVYNETAIGAQNTEDAYLVADQVVYVMSNCNKIANRKVFTFGTDGVLTATGFSGPLTGNVTGDVSGSSGSCTGNALTASSLQTARSLQVSLNKTSATNFQGNANVTNIGVQGILSIANGGTGANTARNAFNNLRVGNVFHAYQNSTNNKQWFKMAEFTFNTTSYDDISLILLAKRMARNTATGILNITASTNESGNLDICHCNWMLFHSAISFWSLDNFKLQYGSNGKNVILWVKVTDALNGIRFTVLDCSSARTGKDDLSGWTIYDYLSGGGSQAAEPTGGTIVTSTMMQSSVEQANQLVTERTIDGINFNGTAAISHYGVCSTKAGTAAKAVACAGYVLTTGSMITVRFANTNTKANPTLNVNSTGAKAIYYRGAAIPAAALQANSTYTFVYNGTQYEIVGSIVLTD